METLERKCARLKTGDEILKRTVVSAAVLCATGGSTISSSCRGGTIYRKRFWT